MMQPWDKWMSGERCAKMCRGRRDRGSVDGRQEIHCYGGIWWWHKLRCMGEGHDVTCMLGVRYPSSLFSPGTSNNVRSTAHRCSLGASGHFLAIVLYLKLGPSGAFGFGCGLGHSSAVQHCCTWWWWQLFCGIHRTSTLSVVVGNRMRGRLVALSVERHCMMWVPVSQAWRVLSRKRAWSLHNVHT